MDAARGGRSLRRGRQGVDKISGAEGRNTYILYLLILLFSTQPVNWGMMLDDDRGGVIDGESQLAC